MPDGIPFFNIWKTNANQFSAKIAVDLSRFHRVIVTMYACPTNIKELPAALTNSQYFSALDLKNAFYQT